MKPHYTRDGQIACMKSDWYQAMCDALRIRWCPSCGREHLEAVGLVIEGGRLFAVMECARCEVTWT